MTITIHALERMEERWGFTNDEIASLRELGPKGELSTKEQRRWEFIENLSDSELKKFQICAGLSDEEIARVIQGEVNDALVAGRKSRMCPLVLAHTNVDRWRASKDVWYVWTETKDRGYVVSDQSDGITVLTTLIGQDEETAKQKLRRH